MVYAPQGQSGNFFNRQERNVRSLQLVEALTFSKDRVARPARVQGRPGPAALALRRRQLQPGGRRRPPRRLAGRANDLPRRDRPTPRSAAPSSRVFAQDRWRVNDRLNFELGLRADRDDVVERVNYSPRVGHVGERAARGPRHPARRLRQVRRAHAADGRRVHAVRRADGQPVRRRRHAARRAGHLRARRRRRAEDARRASCRPSPGISASAAASSSRPPTSIATARTPTRSIRIRAAACSRSASVGASKYWELETTGRYLASEHRDLTVSYVRSHSTRDLNDYDQFFGNFRNPIIRPNENSLSPTDVPNRLIVRGTIGLPGKWVFSPLYEWRTGFPVVGGERVPGFRRRAQPRRAGCRPCRRSTSRSRGRGTSGSTASRPASRSTTPSTPATSATCRPTSPSPDYGTFYNPIQRSIGFVLGTSRP